jgi:hypothetical protein
MHCQVFITSTQKHKRKYLHKSKRLCRRVQAVLFSGGICHQRFVPGENFGVEFWGTSESEENGPQGLVSELDCIWFII